MYKKLIVSIIAIFAFISLHAQETSKLEETMYSNGKIYVVVAVVTVILTAILIYLVTLDRKISKIEKELKEK